MMLSCIFNRKKNHYFKKLSYILLIIIARFSQFTQVEVILFMIDKAFNLNKLLSRSNK